MEKLNELKVKVYDISQECNRLENILRQKQQQIVQLNSEINKMGQVSHNMDKEEK